MALYSEWLKPDGSRLLFHNENVLGIGRFGLVLCHGDHALKIAKISRTPALVGEDAEYEAFDNDGNRESLEIEKAVYRRVGRFPGIAECIDISDEGILMSRYSRGDLESYVRNNARPDTSRLTQWITSTIKTMSHLHKCKILVDDLALRNMLIADDMSLKMIDFGNSSVLPLDADLTKVDEDGFTVQADIFYLGCLIYSIAAWEKFEFCLIDTKYELPPLSELPDLTTVLFGELIKRCWTGHYRDIHQLQSDVLTFSQP
ncbi:MAG: hypothetical protein L6R39_001567 [Caloplaca ligustica]|nr:MAG: hypothetical protein L6R39_001567 [Caloplaca ligustica]